MKDLCGFEGRLEFDSSQIQGIVLLELFLSTCARFEVLQQANLHKKVSKDPLLIR